MANMAKQMNMFDDGGLMDEGGTVDPVSGNDVPVGSTQEEVRDDIPAQLSEGEFVFPADVVRFIGLEKLMKVRQRAKAGLQRMEDMGQMGNSEEAIMPDDLPFSMDDLDMEDDGLEMAQGGVVHMANGGTTQPTIGPFNPPVIPPGIFGTNPNPNPYNLPPVHTTGTGYGYGTIGGVPISGTASGAIGQAAAPMQAASAAMQGGQPGTLPGTQFIPTTVQQALPTFQDTVGMGVSGVDYEEVEYINDAGQIIKLKRSKSTGELLEPVPPGFRPKTDAVEETSTVDTTTDSDKVTVTDDDGGDFDPRAPITSKSGIKGLGSMFTKSKVYNEAVRSLGLNQLSSLNPFQALGATITGSAAPKTVSTMMHQSRVNAAKIFGVTDIDTATVSQLDDIGNIMKTANNFALKDNSLYNSIKTGTPAGVSRDKVDRAVATISGSLAEAVKSGIINSEDLAGIASLERDRKTGAYKSSSGRTVTERATVIGPDGRARTKNIKIDKSVMDYVNAMLGTDDQMTPTEKQTARAATLEAAARDEVRSRTRTTTTARDEPPSDPASTPPSDMVTKSTPSVDTRYTAETNDDDGGGGLDPGESSSSSSSSSDSGPTPEPAAEGQWGDFNKGGLATQMKRSGLASKK